MSVQSKQRIVVNRPCLTTKVIIHPLSTIGAISGTSMDGIDIAWVETDGRDVVTVKGGATLPYPAELRQQLIDFLPEAERAEREPLTALDEAVSDAFTQAIAAFMLDKGLVTSDIDLIGLHGQTVWHRPEKRFTRQLGQGQARRAAPRHQGRRWLPSGRCRQRRAGRAVRAALSRRARQGSARSP